MLHTAPSTRIPPTLHRRHICMTFAVESGALTQQPRSPIAIHHSTWALSKDVLAVSNQSVSEDEDTFTTFDLAIFAKQEAKHG